MGRPRISETVVSEIEDLYFRNPQQTATQVHRAYKRHNGSLTLSYRKVAQCVSGARQRLDTTEPFHFSEWIAWKDDVESPEERLYLLQVREMLRRMFGSNLHDHQAVWAKRLRPGLTGLSLASQCMMIWMYAYRQVMAHYLRYESPRTDDLDAVLTCQPWMGRADANRFLIPGEPLDVHDFPSLEQYELMDMFAWNIYLHSDDDSVRENTIPRIREILGKHSTWHIEELNRFNVTEIREALAQITATDAMPGDAPFASF